MKILLVEDNPGDVRLTRVGFAESGVDVELSVANDGISALNYLAKCQGQFGATQRPNLIILDINLPRMNGRDLLSLLKSDAAFRSIPVIVLSSSSAADDINECYDLMANSYVTKPKGLDGFIAMAGAIGAFWCEMGSLPSY